VRSTHEIMKEQAKISRNPAKCCCLSVYGCKRRLVTKSAKVMKLFCVKRVFNCGRSIADQTPVYVQC
jgi:hypothetical protein